jgi:catechol 2,3-dioxygenase-like lactoylglutathione lyase family enzyme
MYKLKQIDHVAITANNIQASVDWYCEVLGGHRIFADKWEGEPAFIKIGSSSIAIFACPSDKKSDADHNKINIIHIAFKADAYNFKESQNYLRSKNISFRFEDHKVCHSIYFRDPDGHMLEITTYEIG